MMRAGCGSKSSGLLLFAFGIVSGFAADAKRTGAGAARLVDVEPLLQPADFGRLSTAQWDRYLLQQIEVAQQRRAERWQRDVSTFSAYERSIAANRERFCARIGLIDRRVPGPLEIISSLRRTDPLAETLAYEMWGVRWPVLDGVNGEGIMLRPRGEITSFAIMLPDADQVPEEFAGLQPGSESISQAARRLAEEGVLVIIPVMLNRQSTYSGDDRLEKYTDQSHREWIYRQSAEVGRHIIGYEVQKVLALVDLFSAWPAPRRSIGVAGYGEGGLIALYAGAVDPRIRVTWVSGYFQPRERVWTEPLYRSVWGLLEEFGDAEIASMIGGRGLVVEYCRGPTVPRGLEMPPWPEKPNSVSAAPGALTTPEWASVKEEWDRTLGLLGASLTAGFHFTGEAIAASSPFASDAAFGAFARRLDVNPGQRGCLPLSNALAPAQADIERRQYRTFRELQDFTQTQARLSEYSRESFFWSKLEPTNADDWTRQIQTFRQEFHDNVIGRLREPSGPPRARSRIVPEYSTANVTVHEVVLDVFPDVVAWGWLLLPNDIAVGERRPVVVCQHGAGASPVSTIARAPHPDFPYYRAFAADLAERGFVVFSPYNPNTITGESFRQLQRKANLLRASIFSIITRNHATILRWLKRQPFVDAKRIGFYGLSDGGKTAMRVPAILEDYCLSICSGDFNDYVPKMTSVRSDKASFMFGYPYETIEFNLANTFNYAEMAALIAPRPFMVEHGYKDRVAPLEWAAAEYSKVQRLYFRLGIPDRTAIEYFDGPHMIHGRGTFEFLHRFLQWPAPSEAKGPSAVSSWSGKK